MTNPPRRRLPAAPRPDLRLTEDSLGVPRLWMVWPNHWQLISVDGQRGLALTGLDAVLYAIAAGRLAIDPALGRCCAAIFGEPAPRASQIVGYQKVGARWPDRPRWVTASEHRVIWVYVNGPIPAGLVVDHINEVKSDNRIENLQLVTPLANTRLYYERRRNSPACGSAAATTLTMD